MPSRREQIAMTPDEIRAYLMLQRRIIIVSNGPDGFPHPMPMNFTLDDDGRPLITTFTKSQKVKNYERDPRAALLVESGLDYAELKSVMMRATAEILTDRDVIRATMARIAAKESGGDPNAIPETALASVPKRIVIRFTPIDVISWDHGKLGGIY